MAHKITWFDAELLRLINQMRNNEEVKSTIQKEELCNVTDSSKNTLLHMVAQTNAEITRYLIDSGCRVDAQNEHGRTPLMLAVEADYEESVEVLIEAGANIELQDNFGKSALKIIGDCDYASERVLGLLFQKLQIVCFNNVEEIAKKLIRWPLQYVVQLEDSGLTRTILGYGYAAKIDALNGFTLTALHLAVQSVDVENVKVLLEYNANVNAVNDDGQTPLCYVYDAITDRPNERLEILKMLLDRGAVMHFDPSDDYEAHDMFTYANGEAIKLLFQSNIDKFYSFNRHTALGALAENENPGVMEVIHGRGFDVNARYYFNQTTPLIIAASHGNADSVECLLNEGADIDAVDCRNRPAVFHAVNASPKYERCLQLLLERGADVQHEIVSPLQGKSITILSSILSEKLFSLGELVVAHLALQEFLGRIITKTIRTQVDSCDRLKTHFESSKQQLSMKVYALMTLFDALTATDQKLEGYVRNEEFVSKIQDECNALSNHCYFRTKLQNRLSKSIHVAKLKYEAAQVICKITGINYDRYPLIADNIISYLKHKDMINLVDASL